MCKMREKLIDLLTQVQSYGVKQGIHVMHQEGLTNREVADHLLANGVTLATDNNVGGKWIPVEERLPDKEFWEHQKMYEDEDLEVQVMIKGARRPTTLLYNSEGEFYEMNADGQTFYLVTHWAPLMEPPKEV